MPATVDRREVTVRHGSRSFQLSWYVPGTASQDLRETVVARLQLPPHRPFTLEEESGGTTTTLTPGLPSGLTLRVRLEATRSDSPSPLPVATAVARRSPSDLSEPLLSTTCGVEPLSIETRSFGGDGSFKSEGTSSPRPPEDVARDVDSMLKLNRITSALANERTFLAWIRTTCSMFSLAISLNSLDQGENVNWRWLGFGTGLVVTSLGAASYLHSVERYFRVKNVLLLAQPPSQYGRKSIRPFTALVGVVWLAVCLSYVVRGLFMQHILLTHGSGIGPVGPVRLEPNHTDTPARSHS